jgi:hypothetical protein
MLSSVLLNPLPISHLLISNLLIDPLLLNPLLLDSLFLGPLNQPFLLAFKPLPFAFFRIDILFLREGIAQVMVLAHVSKPPLAEGAINRLTLK